MDINLITIINRDPTHNRFVNTFLMIFFPILKLANACQTGSLTLLLFIQGLTFAKPDVVKKKKSLMLITSNKEEYLLHWILDSKLYCIYLQHSTKVRLLAAAERQTLSASNIVTFRHQSVFNSTVILHVKRAQSGSGSRGSRNTRGLNRNPGCCIRCRIENIQN